MGEDVSGLSPASAGHKVVEHVMALNKAIGIPDNIKDLGVDLEYMAQMVSDSMRSANVLVNPRLTTAADVERIIGNAFHGIHS
ncbi:1,3-propanediol dehydrogenase [compost metagenome]